MRVYRIVVETFEPSSSFPIVTHMFQGRTSEQAEAFVVAHEKSDSFFRDCSRLGVFAGKVKCSSRRAFQGWVSV